MDCRKERKKRQLRHIGFTIDSYTNEELRTRYHFGRESIMYITNLLAEDLRRKTQGNNPISVLQQVLIALRFYASGSFLQIIGDTIGVEKSTVSRVVTSVSWVLVAKQQQYIKWPKDQQELGSSSTNVEGFLVSLDMWIVPTLDSNTSSSRKREWICKPLRFSLHKRPRDM